MYTFFEPEPPSDDINMGKGKGTEALKVSSVEKKSSSKVPASKSGSSKSSSHGKTQQRPLPNSDKRTTPNNNSSGSGSGSGSGRRPSPEKMSWNVLDLKGENYFSCAVGRTRTKARFTFGTSDDVISFLNELAAASCSGTSI